MYEEEVKRLELEKTQHLDTEGKRRKRVEGEKKALEEEHEEVHKKLKKSDR
jgi:hypothetical protein